MSCVHFIIDHLAGQKLLLVAAILMTEVSVSQRSNYFNTRAARVRRVIRDSVTTERNCDVLLMELTNKSRSTLQTYFTSQIFCVNTKQCSCHGCVRMRSRLELISYIVQCVGKRNTHFLELIFYIVKVDVTCNKLNLFIFQIVKFDGRPNILSLIYTELAYNLDSKIRYSASNIVAFE